MAENVNKEDCNCDGDPNPAQIVSIGDLIKDGFKILVDATKNSNSLPKDNDFSFFSADTSYKNVMNHEGERILKLMNTIFRHQGINGSVLSRSLDDKLEFLIDGNDTVLEKIADNIDEMAGVRKNPETPVLIQTVSAELPISGSWNKLDKSAITVNNKIKISSESKSTSIRLLAGKNIIRPQSFFKDKIDNGSKFPWQPRITEKPNSLKPLAIFLEESSTGFGEQFSHPYEFELDRFTPKESQLRSVTPQQPISLLTTPLQMVSTPEELQDLVDDLHNFSEIAIDLEHHSYRTFLGITCLLQISTGVTDYIVDTLALRDKLYVLNEIFTKPTIVKVFHGADSDVLWLQRDLSLYVVNMFDTYQAAKQLEYPHLSLAYLLKKFCGIEANKHFQLADWRIRPLPDELIKYAREDTHYLLYIYHHMRNELIRKSNGESNILLAVIQRCTDTCKKRFEKPVLLEDSHMDLYRKYKKLFNNKQQFALKELYRWRDHIAREEDESTGYVLPNHMLLQIAESLPREMQGILACCNPVPPLVRANLLEIHKLILRAREQPLVKPILSEETRSRGSIQQSVRINLDSPLHCPHDVSKSKEFRDDLPTLLSNSNVQRKEFHLKRIEIETLKPSIELFADEKVEVVSPKKIEKLKFLGPFERYKLVKPFVQEEENKIAEAQEQKKSEDKKRETESENIQERDRTDEERMGSLLEHFNEVSRAIPQILPNEIPIVSEPEPLRDYLACKKRKRGIVGFLDELDQSLGLLPCKQQRVDPAPSQDEIIKPRNKNKKKNRKKNVNKNAQGNEFNNAGPAFSNNAGPSFRNNARPAFSNNANRKNVKHMKQRIADLKIQFKTRNSDGNIRGTNKQQFHNHKWDNNKNRKNNNRKNGNENFNQPKTGNNSRRRNSDQQANSRNNFTPFDYSSVDFRQFQGGASGVHNRNAMKANFKGKNKNKKFAGKMGKSFIFKSGRGGGRGGNKGKGQTGEI